MRFYFTSSGEVFTWLSRFINLEQGQKPKSFRLDRMETLCELAGNPEKCAPSIHVAGSKGKGSVTSMLAAMLTAAGYRVARYMSPHVVDVRERICLSDIYFDEEVYVSAGNELRRVTEEILPAANNQLFISEPPEGLPEHLRNEWSGCDPTYWELLTLLFFLCARYAKCDVIVAETGMGGRLDSTNVLDPLVSVITLIELEHTSILGGTIQAIAGEKAGIIKQGKPLVLAKQCDEALEVFKQKAHERNAPLLYLPEIAELSNIKVTDQGTEFSLFFPTSHFSLLTSQFSIPLPGKVQAENAALAIAALNVFSQKLSHGHRTEGSDEPQRIQRDISEAAIRKGLLNLKIPARFEKIADAPPFIIDGAHTPESLALCIETFCSLYGEGGVLLFGCAADKDAAAMAKIAHNYFAKIIVTTPGTFKTSNPEHVFETFENTAGSGKTLLIKDTRDAVRQAMTFAKRGTPPADNALPVLGTGSFYLVSEIRKIVC